MYVHCESSGPFAVNSYFVRDGEEAALVDPGDDDLAWVEALLVETPCSLRYLLLTHGHIDHVAGLAAAKQRFPDAAVLAHRDEAPILASLPMQSALFGLRVQALPPVDRWLQGGEELALGARRLVVEHVPGHTPGLVCFHEHGQQTAFVGDFLFASSIGRTDLPGGDPAAMRRSLAVAKAWPRATRVLSGHGPETTMARELLHNPYLS